MRTLLIIALAATVAACATTDGLSEQQRLSAYEASAGEPVNAFSVVGRVDGWTDLGPRHLAVWTSNNQAYLLDLATPCPDLSEAFAIALTQRLCTFYLPPIWGYLSLRWLGNKGYV